RRAVLAGGGRARGWGVACRRVGCASALPGVAEARGVRARRMELAFLLVMALATSMTVPVVGALLMFSLMIGPAAAARALTARPALAMTLSVVIALVTVWAGIAASYQSDWPLGFFVGVIGAGFFLAGRAYAAIVRSARRPGNTVGPAVRSLRYLAHSRVPPLEQGRARKHFICSWGFCGMAGRVFISYRR